MNWDTVQQLVRILMQIVGTALVTYGYLDEANAAALTGAVVSIAGVAWWALWERKQVATGNREKLN